MIKSAPTGTYCNECVAEFGNFNTVTRTWSFKDNVVPLATVITISTTIKSLGQTRAYCLFHKREAETWPDGKGGWVHWSLEEQLEAARQVETPVLLNV